MRYIARVLDSDGATLIRVEADLQRDLDVIHFLNRAIAEYRSTHPEASLLGRGPGVPRTLTWEPSNA